MNFFNGEIRLVEKHYVIMSMLVFNSKYPCAYNYHPT